MDGTGRLVNHKPENLLPGVYPVLDTEPEWQKQEKMDFYRHRCYDIGYCQVQGFINTIPHYSPQGTEKEVVFSRLPGDPVSKHGTGSGKRKRSSRRRRCRFSCPSGDPAPRCGVSRWARKSSNPLRPLCLCGEKVLLNWPWSAPIKGYTTGSGLTLTLTLTRYFLIK